MKVDEISGIGEFNEISEKVSDGKNKKEYVRRVFKVGERAFLVENPHTIEVRCDEKLRDLLISKYESVMESRFFGRRGIEIVSSANQLSEAEIQDLVRLSYNLSLKIE